MVHSGKSIRGSCKSTVDPHFDFVSLFFFSNSAGEIIATLPTEATAAAFGGNDLKTIFAVISSLQIDPISLAVTGQSLGDALYSISGVGARGTSNPKVNV